MMSILIDKNTKVICQGTIARAASLAVCDEMAITPPHSFTYPAGLMQETRP
jgi:succinyl-CoA synthetase alpha subunit